MKLPFGTRTLPGSMAPGFAEPHRSVEPREVPEDLVGVPIDRDAPSRSDRLSSGRFAFDSDRCDVIKGRIRRAPVRDVLRNHSASPIRPVNQPRKWQRAPGSRRPPSVVSLGGQCGPRESQSVSGAGQWTPDPETNDQSPAPQITPFTSPGARAIFPLMITLPSSSALQQPTPPPPPLETSSWLAPTKSHTTSSGPTPVRVQVAGSLLFNGPQDVTTLAPLYLNFPPTTKRYFVAAPPVMRMSFCTSF